MTARERISTAQVSKNLSEATVDAIGDIDIIRACGMVGASMPVGVALWRLKYSGDSSEFPRAAVGLIEMMERRGWAGEDVPQLVHSVLRHWLDDVCKSCHGRGYETVPGTPMLSEIQCGACHGQGRLPVPVEGEPGEWLVETIGRLEREVASAIMRKLNAELDF